MIAVGWPSWRSANYIIVQSYSQRNDSVRHKLTRTVLQVNLELKAFVSCLGLCTRSRQVAQQC